jgi:hypothetical protein
MITLDSPSPRFWAVFFVVATNLAISMAARNIVHNGKDRSAVRRQSHVGARHFFSYDQPAGCRLALVSAMLTLVANCLLNRLRRVATLNCERSGPRPAQPSRDALAECVALAEEKNRTSRVLDHPGGWLTAWVVKRSRCVQTQECNFRVDCPI